MRIFITIIFGLIVSAGEVFGCQTTDLITSGNGGGQVILSRPHSQHNWPAPDGFFRIHYDTEGPWAVYQADVDIDPMDGIPDYVNRTADYLELSYDVFGSQSSRHQEWLFLSADTLFE